MLDKKITDKVYDAIIILAISACLFAMYLLLFNKI